MALRLWSWRSTSVGICASKEALCATGRARTAADTNAVHARLLQSMRVRFSDSEQWSSPVKPPRSQNYVKPHDARTQPSVRQAALEQLPTTNAVHDRLLQSMRVRFSNNGVHQLSLRARKIYVKPNNARTRVHDASIPGRAGALRVLLRQLPRVTLPRHWPPSGWETTGR